MMGRIKAEHNLSKKRGFNFDNERIEKLEWLKKHYGQSYSWVVSRALDDLYHKVMVTSGKG
jgi:hypothetical protein